MRYNLKTLLILMSLTALAAISLGCVAESDEDFEPPIDEHVHEHEHADGDHAHFDTVEQAAAISGRWQIPASVEATGNGQFVSYTGAGAWRGSGSCSGGMQEGTRRLRDFLAQNFPQISNQGGYACRAIRGNSSKMSVHGTGRALDIHIPLAGGQADNDLGDPIAQYLIENAQSIGIQFIIWDRSTWGAHRSSGNKFRSYGGSHPHHDHLHIELSTEGGRARTPFFLNGMPAPGAGAEPCDTITAASAKILDNSGPCMQTFGPDRYWRKVTAQGNEGGLIWTNAWRATSPSNWARWNMHFEAAGEYMVEVNTGGEFGLYDKTRYTVEHNGQKSDVVIDQAAIDGWQSLGRFSFAEGGGQHVSLYDNYSVTVSSGQHIMADAVRVTHVDAVDMGPDPDLNLDGDASGEDHECGDGADKAAFMEETSWIDPEIDEPAPGDDGHTFTDPTTTDASVNSACTVAAPSSTHSAPFGALLALGLVIGGVVLRTRR